ncbi:MAG: TIGR00153 family protein [Gammaproteobacteria bacterium]|nr:TIGR00153 family protein [Gammaproteobacteria bacterium]
MAFTRIINIFGYSPIKPLEMHMDKVIQCARELLPFFEKVINQDWRGAEEYHQLIISLEGEADTLKKDLRLHLPKSLFLPVSRSDLLQLLSTQDGIANKARDISGVVAGRQMAMPMAIGANFLAFLSRCLDAAAQAQKAINELDELLEVGFRGKEVQLVEKMINELDKIEQDTDRMQVEVRQGLFKMEKELSVIDVIFLYKVIEQTGGIADLAHQIGGQLQLLLAH